MPFWVEQTKGSHKSKIDNAIAMYRKGIYTAEDAWSKLSALYLDVHPTTEPPLFKNHLHNWDYMIQTWFPLYANMWYESTEKKCKRWAWRMAYSEGNEYAVRYEY